MKEIQEIQLADDAGLAQEVKNIKLNEPAKGDLNAAL